MRNYSFNIGGPATKKSSYFFDISRRDQQDNAITYAQYVDPQTYSIVPVTTAVVTPNLNTTISPRFDQQFGANNTLTVRFEDRFGSRDNAGLGGTKLPPGFLANPPSELAYDTNNNAQNLMVTETNIITPKVVNETRFQFTRTHTISDGNMLPTITISNEFTTGGNGVGDTHDVAKHFELQNYTSISKGTHTIRFGVRVRRESDQSNQPQGFNGSFTFLGGDEPVLSSGTTRLSTMRTATQRLCC